VNSTGAVIAVVVGFAAFWLAKWLRARADVKSTAEGLQIRLAERRAARMWLLVLSGALILWLLSKGASS
jgi:hypothetical protein